MGNGALLAFGLLSPFPSTRRLGWRRVAALLPLAWTIGVVAALLNGASPTATAAWAEVAARCTMALPGGLLAAGTLRRQALRFTDLPFPSSTRLPLHVAAASMGGFSLLSALTACFLFTTPPPPPSLLLLPLLSSVAGFGAAWGLARTLNLLQLEVERWIEGVERGQALMAERERISRELHDGIIQSIYAAGLMLEGVLQTIPEDPQAAREQIGHVMTSLNRTIQDIRRYIFNLRGESPEEDLQEGLEEILRDFRINTLLETRLIVEGEPLRPLYAEERAHLFQIVREALSNVARHAKARRVEVLVAYGEETLRLRIADDGVGMAPSFLGSGQGLRNIRERARLLGGTLDIDSAPGRGVTLTVTMPYGRKGERR